MDERERRRQKEIIDFLSNVQAVYVGDEELTVEPTVEVGGEDSMEQEGIMTKKRKQRRAEAVERLRELQGDYTVYQARDVLAAMVDWSGNVYDQLIDLLSEDEEPDGDGDLQSHESVSVRQENETTDSREKLEEDVREWCAAAVYPESRERQICEWLNRQAAITHRERDMEWSLNCDGMQKLLDERARENDELRYRLDRATSESRYELDRKEWALERDVLVRERDELRKDNETLARREVIELPKDADGKHIRIGDTIESGDLRIGPIDALTIRADGEWEARENGIGYAITGNNLHFQHHKPTVADVLQEFAREMAENTDLYVGEAIDADEREEADRRTVAKYEGKLQLREDES